MAEKPAAIPLWRAMAAVWTVVVLASCSGGGDITGPTPEYWAGLYDWSDAATWNDPGNWPDIKLRSFVYSGQSGPPGFYREDPGLGAPYYENTISTGLLAGQWAELATTDLDSARTWSEVSATNSAYYRDLVSEGESDRYFEFTRVYALHPSDVIRSRVHKRGYLDRSMYDRLHPTAVVGVFRERPLTVDAVRGLVEYMWANSMLADPARPLSSDMRETADAYIDGIYYVAVTGGDFGTCDTIHFGLASVRVDKVTGAVTWEAARIRDVTGICYER